jgi:hypothetical protein
MRECWSGSRLGALDKCGIARPEIPEADSNRHVWIYSSTDEFAGLQLQVTEAAIRYQRSLAHIVSLAK